MKKMIDTAAKKSRFRVSLNQSGMSILQVLISLGISALIGMFVMQTVLQMRQVDVLMALSADASDVEANFKRVLIVPLACMKTLFPAMEKYGGLTNEVIDKGVALQEIRDATFDLEDPTKSAPLWKIGDPLANGTLILEKIVLSRRHKDGTIMDITKNDVKKIFLDVRFLKVSAQKNSGVAFGGAYLERQIPIAVRTDNFAQITECTSLDEDGLVAKICKDLSGGPAPSGGPGCSFANSPVIIKAICGALGRPVGTNKTCL